MRARDVLLLGLLAALWGASFLFIRVAAPALRPFPLMAGRVVLAALLLFAWARVRGERLSLRAHARPLLLLGLLHAAAPFALIATAELRLTASTAAVLLAVQPMFVLLWSARWLGERIAPRQVAGLLLGLVGVGALVGWRPGGFDRATLGSAAAVLLAAALYAGGSLYAKHRLRGVPVLSLALGQQLGAAAWLLAPAALTWHAALPTPRAVWALVALASLCTALAYLIFFGLIERIGAMRASTVTYAIPVFGVAWGWFGLAEPVTAGVLAGLGGVLASLWLVNARGTGRIGAGAPRGALPATSR